MDPLEYMRALNAQLTYLFAYARTINEIDTAAALFGEMRGEQDAGWTTVITAHEVFGELNTLGRKGEPLTRPELRQVLCLYTQLAEAGGVYEGLLNTMQVVELKPYNLWPFQNLVRVRQAPRAVIGPNANAMFRHLAEVATAIGMTGLARLLEVTFRDDIRNAIAHADYIIAPDGLRLRRRNGGIPFIVDHAAITHALQIALGFFELLHEFQREVRESYRPARTIIGRFSLNPPQPWTIELAENGAFSISGRAPIRQVDAAYERQERINNRLGGRVVAAYAGPGSPVADALITEIGALGFDPLVISFDSENEFHAVVREIDEHDLWDGVGHEGSLVVTPTGFRRIASGAAFEAWLPTVEPIEF